MCARSAATGRAHTRRFADLAVAVAKLSAQTLVLDGEGAASYERQLGPRNLHTATT